MVIEAIAATVARIGIGTDRVAQVATVRAVHFVIVQARSQTIAGVRIGAFRVGVVTAECSVQLIRVVANAHQTLVLRAIVVITTIPDRSRPVRFVVN